MEIRNIKTFIRAAETGNFTKTADELGYSQGTVTPSSVDSTMKVPTHNLPSYPQTLENTGVCPYFFVAKFFLL